MLVLFETAGGYALFKVLNEKKLKDAGNLWKEFETPEKASEIVKLMAFKRFKDTTDALQAATSLLDGKIDKGLKKLLKKFGSDAHESLAVADAKMGALIKEKFDISCVFNTSISELMRGIRGQMDSLITEMPKKDMTAMALGLAHSLSRYKVKFNAEKVDTMIIQAVSLLDDLDKELNNYVMRNREWYGWHFPELGKIIQDHFAFAKCVKKIGMRTNTATTDLTDILPEDLCDRVKEAAEISMGTEISNEDIENISHLCDQILELNDYRLQLSDYLRNRMVALAPNLTVLLGELVGARLISHAGSLINLAKYPASTVQILGAEKALFRALKTKRDTPKYGLIYHAKLLGQAPGPIKGKMARMLAAKTSIACRVDALGEDVSSELGVEHRAKLEERMKVLSESGTKRLSGFGRKKSMMYSKKDGTGTMYNPAADSTIPKLSKKRPIEEVNNTVDDEDAPEESPRKTPKKKKMKRLSETEPDENDEMAAEEESPPVKKKKKKRSE